MPGTSVIQLLYEQKTAVKAVWGTISQVNAKTARKQDISMLMGVVFISALICTQVKYSFEKHSYRKHCAGWTDERYYDFILFCRNILYIYFNR